MPDPALRLPARPSLEQLRKQAKERLEHLRASDPAATLAEAQLALARELGFASWPKLVEHVEQVHSSGRLAHCEQLAKDLLSAHGRDDTDALRRLTDHFAHNVTRDEIRYQVGMRIGTEEFTLPEAQRVVASLHGFGDWAGFAASLAQPPAEPGAAQRGMTSTPPFYRIDRQRNTIEPRPPLSDQDWDTIFGVMKEMGITGLNASGHMTDAVMARVVRLSFVKSLRLEGSRQLSDDGLLHLSRMPQLEELELGGTITDRGLEVLRHLGELKRFQMCWSQRITDAGVANLTFCDRLEDVNLLGSTTGDGAINALRGKRHLRQFKTGRLVTDTGLPLLHDFPVFKTWQGGTPRYDLMSFGDTDPNFLMLDGPFSDAGLAALADLDGLFGLGFFGHVTGMSANGLKSLAELPNLGALSCDGDICTDTAMRHIAAIPRLRMLMAQGTVASDDGFMALSKSRTVEYIWGRECPNLRGRGFAALAEMPALKGLAVSCARVDDAALSSLPRFPALTWLMPMDVPDAGFRHVGHCAQLVKLTCMYCRDTGDAATEHLAGLPGLKHYYAGQTRITDRSLEVLGGMTSLEEIELSACTGISNGGLLHIARLPRLRKVSVDATPRVTRAGIAVFPAHVRVDFW